MQQTSVAVKEQVLALAQRMVNEVWVGDSPPTVSLDYLAKRSILQDVEYQDESARCITNRLMDERPILAAVILAKYTIGELGQAQKDKLSSEREKTLLMYGWVGLKEVTEYWGVSLCSYNSGTFTFVPTPYGDNIEVWESEKTPNTRRYTVYLTWATVRNVFLALASGITIGILLRHIVGVH